MKIEFNSDGSIKVPKESIESEEGISKLCPFCKEMIEDDITWCPHCDKKLMSKEDEDLIIKRNTKKNPQLRNNFFRKKVYEGFGDKCFFCDEEDEQKLRIHHEHYDWYYQYQ